MSLVCVFHDVEEQHEIDNGFYCPCNRKPASTYRARRKDTYTQMELDEVREELATH
ncbi:hypothetical protein GBA52_027823, partial [Prunus armeniaca]